MVGHVIYVTESHESSALRFYSMNYDSDTTPCVLCITWLTVCRIHHV